MANDIIFTNARIFFGGADLSTDLNQVQMQLTRVMLDGSVFGDTFKRNKPGLGTAKGTITGFWNAGTNPDKAYPTLFTNLGTNDVLLTVFGNGITEGTSTNKGMGLNTTQSMFNPINSGKHGDLLGYTATFESRGQPMIGAVPLKDSSLVMNLGSGVGTGYNVGAVASGSYLYGGLHVVAYQGTTPTLAATIQSSPDNTFAAPTTRMTFATVNGVTTWQYPTRVAGAITDAWWRTTWAIGGTGTPGFQFLIWMGIAGA